MNNVKHMIHFQLFNPLMDWKHFSFTKFNIANMKLNLFHREDLES